MDDDYTTSWTVGDDAEPELRMLDRAYYEAKRGDQTQFTVFDMSRQEKKQDESSSKSSRRKSRIRRKARPRLATAGSVRSKPTQPRISPLLSPSASVPALGLRSKDFSLSAYGSVGDDANGGRGNRRPQTARQRTSKSSSSSGSRPMTARGRQGSGRNGSSSSGNGNTISRRVRPGSAARYRTGGDGGRGPGTSRFAASRSWTPSSSSSSSSSLSSSSSSKKPSLSASLRARGKASPRRKKSKPAWNNSTSTVVVDPAWVSRRPPLPQRQGMASTSTKTTIGNAMAAAARKKNAASPRRRPPTSHLCPEYDDRRREAAQKRMVADFRKRDARAREKNAPRPASETRKKSKAPTLRTAERFGARSYAAHRTDNTHDVFRAKPKRGRPSSRNGGGGGRVQSRLYPYGK